jgi:DNA-binding protein HU-beta
MCKSSSKGAIKGMNKLELISKVAEKSGLKKKDAETAVNSVLDTISEALAAGDKVQLIGFGTFETRKRSARSGRNPQTGEVIQIPEAVVPAFKPGNKLKEATK